MWTAYGLLAVAICAEVVATSALKASAGFTRPAPTVLVIGGYLLAFWSLARVVQHVPVGVVYALWAGLGLVLVVAIAATLHGQVPDLAAVVGMALIAAGVAVIQLGSGMTAEAPEAAPAATVEDGEGR